MPIFPNTSFKTFRFQGKEKTKHEGRNLTKGPWVGLERQKPHPLTVRKEARDGVTRTRGRGSSWNESFARERAKQER